MHDIVACVTWYRLYSRYRVWYLYKHQSRIGKMMEILKSKHSDIIWQLFFLLWKILTIKKLLIYSDFIDNIGQVFKKFSFLCEKEVYFTHICRAKFEVLTCYNIFGGKLVFFSFKLFFFLLVLIFWCPITRFLYFVLLKCHVWRC